MTAWDDGEPLVAFARLTDEYRLSGEGDDSATHAARSRDARTTL
ncbi:hypothetical protein QF037_000518 [Streptomyces canus]|nr:hypothetical protein [Streptomyces canus]MDQ0596173.1 hypothetical protein [Streptomyces canus]